VHVWSVHGGTSWPWPVDQPGCALRDEPVREVRTVSSLIDNRRAMPAFDTPSAAASTILAR
jgi:hypothetical protein